MNIQNVRQFLDIDPDFSYKVYKRQGERAHAEDEEEGEDENEICMNFKRQGSSTI